MERRTLAPFLITNSKIWKRKIHWNLKPIRCELKSWALRCREFGLGSFRTVQVDPISFFCSGSHACRRFWLGFFRSKESVLLRSFYGLVLFSFPARHAFNWNVKISTAFLVSRPIAAAASIKARSKRDICGVERFQSGGGLRPASVSRMTFQCINMALYTMKFSMNVTYGGFSWKDLRFRIKIESLSRSWSLVHLGRTRKKKAYFPQEHTFITNQLLFLQFKEGHDWMNPLWNFIVNESAIWHRFSREWVTFLSFWKMVTTDPLNNHFGISAACNTSLSSRPSSLYSIRTDWQTYCRSYGGVK